MRATLQWHTQAGTLTADNRDACAHVELPHANLYLIADGSSSRLGSGELANELIAQLVQGLRDLPATERSAAQWAEALLQIITNSHQTLPATYPQAACSYLLLCRLADAAFSVHEGDCCLGLIEPSGTLNWLNSPHCVANWQGSLTHAEVAQEPSRHRLTRCFSARRASNPELNYWPTAPSQHWLLASDGFWAGLDTKQQLSFLRDGNLLAPPTDDDISCLSIITPPTG